MRKSFTAGREQRREEEQRRADGCLVFLNSAKLCGENSFS
jgi:hypothetical protein